MDLRFACDWEDAGTRKTRFGERRVLVCHRPTPAFWNLWRTAKLSLRQLGVSIHKRASDGGYSVEWEGGILLERQPVTLPPPDSTIVIPPDIQGMLLPWQPDIVVRLASGVRRWGGAIDGSGTGVGKTTAALATGRTLGYRRAVVLCPLSVMPAWEEWGQRMGITTWPINYEMAVRDEGIPGLISWRGKVPEWEPGDYLLICDEGHRCGGLTTKISRLVKQARRQLIAVLIATATLGDTPLKLGATGECVGLFTGDQFYPWLIRNACVKGKYGWEFAGSDAVMVSIRDQLLSQGRMVSVKPDDIPGFPEAHVDTLLLNTGAEQKINSAYDDMELLIQEFRNAPKNDRNYRCRIHEINRRIELAKLPATVELLKDAVASGNCGLFFVHYRETAIEASEMLGWPLLIGDESNRRTRQQTLQDLAADRIPGIVGVDAISGEGINCHDVTGVHPRYTCIFPSGSSRLARQCKGRSHRAGAKSKAIIRFVLAAGTREMETARRLMGKLNRLDALTDVDYLPYGAADSAALAAILETQ